MTSTQAEPPEAPEPSEQPVRSDQGTPAAAATGVPLTVQPGDFYLERGLMVFTAAYHLRRGYCCGNRCRHCPYQEWKR
jgi:hypothetical protein